jgi:hypothetical protein
MVKVRGEGTRNRVYVMLQGGVDKTHIAVGLTIEGLRRGYIILDDLVQKQSICMQPSRSSSSASNPSWISWMPWRLKSRGSLGVRRMRPRHRTYLSS